MSGSLEAVRVFEAKYYSDMPKHVKDMAELRNEGIRKIRVPKSTEFAASGANDLARSVRGLRDAGNLYRREYFASLYMQAVGEFSLGILDAAGDFAASAMENIPEVPEEFAEDIIADQYVAIASAKLSLILKASFDGQYSIAGRDEEKFHDLAFEAARLARRTCRHSEDGSRMLFVNGEMSESERKKVRRRHTIAAAGATAGLWLPRPAELVLAEKICRKHG